MAYNQGKTENERKPLPENIRRADYITEAIRRQNESPDRDKYDGEMIGETRPFLSEPPYRGFFI